MSTAWACHYKKNTPGYQNPWETCTDEILNMLVCADPTYNRELQFVCTGYSYGAPVNTYYAGAKCFFEFQTFSGNVEPGKEASGAYVSIVLYQTALESQISKKLLLNTSVQTNGIGYYSGEFTTDLITSTPTKTPYLSGTYFGYCDVLREEAPEGQYVGLFSTGQQMSIFASPSTTFTFDATANTCSINITNQDPNLKADFTICASNDYGNSFSTLQTSGIIPAGTWDPVFSEGLSTNFKHYQIFIRPTGFVKEYMFEEHSGGHPPAPTGLRVRWYYEDDSLGFKEGEVEGGDGKIASIPCLETDIISGLWYLYGNGGDKIYTEYSEDNVTWNPIGNQTIIQDMSMSGYFLQSIETEFAATKTYWFRVYGVRLEPGPNTFYSLPYSAGPFSASQITTYTKTSTTGGCGVNIWWEGPNFTYVLKISGQNDGIETETAVPASIEYGGFGRSYYHDVTDNCGKIYYYRACKEGSDECSTQVAGSGILYLKQPSFIAYPVNINKNEMEIPTNHFRIELNWNNAHFDDNARVISGYRYEWSEDGTQQLSTGVYWAYNSLTKELVHADNFFNDPGIPMRSDHRNYIDYKLKLMRGNISGDYSYYSIGVPRKPETPRITGLDVNSDRSVSIFWTGTAWESSIEQYLLFKTKNYTSTYTISIIEIAVGDSFYDDNDFILDEERPREYRVVTKGKTNLYPSFAAYSDFSNVYVASLADILRP